LQVWAADVTPSGATREWQLDFSEFFVGPLPALQNLPAGQHRLRLRHLRSGKVSDWSATVAFEVVN
jgi:hypothetical protein